VAEDAVERYELLAADNPAHLPGLAIAINNLSTSYRMLGRLAEAVPVAEDAVERYKLLAADNPAHLPGLALALNNLGACYQEMGRGADAENIWENSLAGMSAAMQVELLFHRAFSRNTAAAAVSDLQRASGLIEIGNLATTGQLHDVARSCRAERPSDFEDAWKAAAGEIPAWLILDPDFLEFVAEWVVTPTYSAACSFAKEHAAELLDGQTDLALDELNLRVGDITATTDEQSVLAEARERGFEEAYGPYLARELVQDYLDNDLNTQTQYIRDHQSELLDNENFIEALNQLFDENDPRHRSGIALVELAKGRLLEEALPALSDHTQFAVLATQAALGSDPDPVLALSWLAQASSTDGPTVAAALFFGAVGSVLSAQTELGADQLRDARRVHNATVQGLIPTLLQLTATHTELAVLAPVLSEPLPTSH
jgi:hypothetical protein